MSAAQLQSPGTQLSQPPTHPMTQSTINTNNNNNSSDYKIQHSIPSVSQLHTTLSNTLLPYVHSTRTYLQSLFSTLQSSSNHTVQSIDNELDTTYKYTRQLKSYIVNNIQSIRSDPTRTLQTIGITTLGIGVLSFPYGRRFIIQNSIFSMITTSFIIQPYQTKQLVVNGLVNTDNLIHNYAARLNKPMSEHELIQSQYLPCGCAMGIDHLPHTTLGKLDSKQDTSNVIAHVEKQPHD